MLKFRGLGRPCHSHESLGSGSLTQPHAHVRNAHSLRTLPAPHTFLLFKVFVYLVLSLILKMDDWMVCPALEVFPWEGRSVALPCSGLFVPVSRVEFIAAALSTAWVHIRFPWISPLSAPPPPPHDIGQTLAPFFLFRWHLLGWPILDMNVACFCIYYSCARLTLQKSRMSWIAQIFSSLKSSSIILGQKPAFCLLHSYYF